MKLDKDLVRQILLAIETSEDDPRSFLRISLPDREPMQVSYHVLLLHEAGLIEATNTGSMSQFEWSPQRLTYNGHEFLDTVRDAEIWRKTKMAATAAGGASLNFLWELAKAEVRTTLGLP